MSLSTDVSQVPERLREVTQLYEEGNLPGGGPLRSLSFLTVITL